MVPAAGGERRLRSMLWHERMAVAMAVAESLHHSAQRRSRTSTKRYDDRRLLHPGKRPGVLKDPVPQGRVGQHCGVDVPVLQMVEQHVEVLQFSPQFVVPWQVVEVPILSLPVCVVQPCGSPRTTDGGTVWLKCRRLSPSSSRTPTFQFRIVLVVIVFKVFPHYRVQLRLVGAQHVDIPSSGGGLRVFIPRQSSTAPASEIVDIPTSGGPHGFLPRQGSAAYAAENVDFPAGGGLHGLRPGQGFPALSGPGHAHDAPWRSRRGGGPGQLAIAGLLDASSYCLVQLLTEMRRHPRRFHRW